MTKEIWKNVSELGVITDSKGKELDMTIFDNYWVSTIGRIYNDKTKRLLPKKEQDYNGSDRYKIVNLTKGNENHVCILVHRLVAFAFVPNPNNYPRVTIINENKNDIRFENLEWCDMKYVNNLDSKLEKFSNKVKQFSLDGKLIKIWKSIEEVSRNGFIQQAVCACCNGRRSTHKGYRWVYYKKNIDRKNCKVGNKPKRLRQLTLDGKVVQLWVSARECGRNGYNSGGVSNCCNGRCKTYKGYRWEFF